MASWSSSRVANCKKYYSENKPMVGWNMVHPSSIIESIGHQLDKYPYGNHFYNVNYVNEKEMINYEMYCVYVCVFLMGNMIYIMYIYDE